MEEVDFKVLQEEELFETMNEFNKLGKKFHIIRGTSSEINRIAYTLGKASETAARRVILLLCSCKRLLRLKIREVTL